MGRSHLSTSSLKLSGVAADRPRDELLVRPRHAERGRVPFSQKLRRLRGAAGRVHTPMIAGSTGAFKALPVYYLPVQTPARSSLSASWLTVIVRVTIRSLQPAGPGAPRHILMPRDTRTRRLTRPAGGGRIARDHGRDSDDPLRLVTLLARTERLIDLLPQLHQHALDATEAIARCSSNSIRKTASCRRRRASVSTSSRRTPGCPSKKSTSWSRAHSVETSPTLVGDLARRMPQLGERLGVRSALLVPLASGTQRVGLLAIGFEGAPSANRGDRRRRDF